MDADEPFKKDSLRKWAVLLVASLLIFFVYMMQYQIASLAFLIIPQFNIDTVQLANLMLIPMLLAAALGIPLGFLADRFSVKLVVGVDLIVSVFGAYLRVGASDYATALCSMLLLGFAPAALNSNVIKLLGAWFETKTSVAIGIYYAFSGLGASAAMLSASLIANTREAFLASAIGLTVILIAWWILVPENKGIRGEAGRHSINSALTEPRSSWKYFAQAAKVQAVWIIALITGLGLASKTAYLGFLPTALSETVGPEQSNILASFVTYGGIVGCAMGPAICLKRKHPKAILVAFAIAAACLISASSFLLDNPSWILLFVVGMSTSVTAPIVEAIPAALPSLHGCVGSAGGIIGTVSLMMSYALPIIITAISESNMQMLVILTGACFLLTVPLIALLPKPETT